MLVGTLGRSEDDRGGGFVGAMKPWHGTEHLEEIARGAESKLLLIGPNKSSIDGAICPGHLKPQDLADAVAALDVGLAPSPADAPPWFCPRKVAIIFRDESGFRLLNVRPNGRGV